MAGLALDIGDVVSRGFGWWTGALARLVPSMAARRNRPLPDRTLLLRGGHLRDAEDAGATDADPAGGEARLLDEIARASRRKGVRVRIRVPASECLVRSLDIPRAARADAARIARLDLERATPLNAEQLAVASVVAGEGISRQTLRIEQYVVKRAKIDSAATRIAEAGAIADGADVVTSDGKGLYPLSPALAAPPAPQPLTLTAGLAALALMLGLASLWVAAVRNEQALADLREQTAAARASLERMRTQSAAEVAKGSASAALLELKARRPQAARILEDLSTRLPDTAWLTEFRLTATDVEIAGYARPAAELAPLLEQSPLIESAALNAPIVADSEQGKERFGLRLRLSGVKLNAEPDAVPEAAP